MFFCKIKVIFSVVAVAALSLMAIFRSAALADTQSKIYAAAKQSVGKEMWKGYGLPNGKLGCAAALCNVLKVADVQNVRSPLVTVVRGQLLAHKSVSERVVRAGEGSEISEEKLLKDCHPGDIILAFMNQPTKSNGGASAHCGVMGEGTTIYTYNWNDGKWTALDIHLMFDYYPYVRLLRLR